jgi:ParB/RepB/Spo0J family partition protein
MKNNLVIPKKAKSKIWDINSLSGNAPIAKTEAVEEVQKEFALTEGSFIVQALNLDDIVADPDQPRDTEKLEEEYLDNLGNSIYADKQLYPIIVRPNPLANSDAHWMIVDGECRWLSMGRHPDLNTITAITLSDDLDLTDILLMQVTANDKRKGTSTAEKANAYARIYKGFKAKGLTQQDVANKLGIKRTTLSKYTSISENNEVMKMSYDDITQDFNSLSLLCTIYKKSSVTGQKIVGNIRAGKVDQELRRFLEDVLQGLSEEQPDQTSNKSHKTVKPKFYKPTSATYKNIEGEDYISLDVKGKFVQISVSEIKDDLLKIVNEKL